jgi:CubicO group peptidase (beta-lactamase class C family)
MVLKTWTFPDNDFSRNRPITLGHLLSHTAGLGVHGFRGYPKGQTLPSINEILDGKLTRWPTNTPGPTRSIIPL